MDMDASMVSLAPKAWYFSLECDSQGLKTCTHLSKPLIAPTYLVIGQIYPHNAIVVGVGILLTLKVIRNIFRAQGSGIFHLSFQSH